jgi:arylsulfatase A-like enzyme
MTWTVRQVLLSVLVVTSMSCTGSITTSPVAIRLIDLFDAKRVEGSVKPAATPRPTIWRFDGAPPSPAPARFAGTRGWEPGPGISGLTVKDGQLVGRATGGTALIHFDRTSVVDVPDTLHAIEVRMRASQGANLSIQTSAAPTVNLINMAAAAARAPWPLRSPIQAGETFQTYELIPLAPIVTSRIRHIVIRPTDAEDATFAIESVRLVTRTEHLASIPAGIGWQGLQQIYRESLVAHAPETMQFDVQLPERPWLDLAVGTVEDGAVTFRVVATPRGAPDDRDAIRVDYTVTQPHRWDSYPIDLSRLAGQAVTLSLQLQSESAGALGFWGSPVVRALGAPPQIDGAAAGGGNGNNRPQGVIFIQADTLRRDHLNQYGHSRETAPFLTRMAKEGVQFNHAISQASWTKVSTSSLMTGLYPRSHGVSLQTDRLPSAVTTMAEVYKAAGYATLSLSSVPFTGQYTNLHQGFEELHESGSLSTAGTPFTAKTAREYVDRLVTWVERHREVPFFAYLQVFDPHHPYEPYRPYNTKWGDPDRPEQHRKERDAVTKLIADPFMRTRSLPSRDEVIKAGFDPARYVVQEIDWYDGSIRAMDVEMARLFEQLRRMGLDENTLVVLTSDHGTEFHDHGRFWHGQSVYGELINVPLIIRWPAGVARARVVDDLVQTIDIMPTMLELSGLTPPAEVQGQSLRPFLTATPAGGSASATSSSGWKPRPAISERTPNVSDAPPDQSRESVGIIEANWKLIQNTTRTPGLAEFELFDYFKDPLDKHNVAADHPDVVARLAKLIEGWRRMATAARVKPDAEATKTLSAEELQRLRSLGYVR